MSDKLHDRVAEMLGMELADEDDDPVETMIPESAAIVPMPETAEQIENPELPSLISEMVRIEHGQQQTEIMLNRGMAAVDQALAELPLMIPVYQARAREAAAELFKAVADLAKFKIDVQIKLVELKLKLAAFTRNKQSSQSPLGTGNTFFLDREDLMKNLASVAAANLTADEA
jgi:hypothetical protein